jgi:glyoxylase-like metal-dependent hydrolase (beta-lactamase superfamily II)
MTLPVCVQCGVQYGEPREDCPICTDEREYVRWDGQAWMALEEIRRGHRNRIEEEGPGLWGIGTEPAFAIGQRALLVQAHGGNVLWDCVSLIDDDTAARIGQLGGVSAIAISHPHYYGVMAEWSRAFDDAPIYIHAADQRWLGRRDNVVLWEGAALEIGEGLTLLNCAVHFDGGTVLHWAGGEHGAGALLSGDIFQVVMDRRYVSFMYSYPNLIPERPDIVRRAVRLTEPYPFTRIYGAWWGRNVAADAKAALRRSADRYLSYAEGTSGAARDDAGVCSE